jgi:hypothetical protein
MPDPTPARPPLYVWHFTRTDEDIDDGHNTQHVIIAPDEHAARIMAGRAAREENGIVWMMDSTTAVLLGVATIAGAGVVMTETEPSA